MTRLTVKQAAERLSVSEQAVREMTKRGLIGRVVGTKEGRKTYLIYEELIERWLSQ